MLAQALEVVEAARRLMPAEVPGLPGLYRVGCAPRDVPGILRDIALAIEAFDATSSSRADPYAAIARGLRFAESMGVPRAGMIAAMRGDPGAAADDLPTAAPRLDPAPGDVGPPDPTVLDPRLARSPDRGTAKPADGRAPRVERLPGRTPSPAPEPPVPDRPVLAAAPAAVASLRSPVPAPDVDAERALEDGDGTVDDLEGMVDAIEDRLEYAAGRGIRTPRVMALMGALRRARQAIRAKDAEAMPGPADIVRLDAEVRLVEEEAAPVPAYGI